MKRSTALTNEEKRVRQYSRDKPPTYPEEVTAQTPLEGLNLNWREKDLPQRKRTKHVHRLHPYLGKFVPQLVEIFLRKFFKPGDTVYDPFCGSGTTLVEANVFGAHAIGYDIAPFNCLLCRAKTANYDTAVMEKEVLDILGRVRIATQKPFWSKKAAEACPDERDNEYLQAWFAPRARVELLTYRSLIPKYENQDLLKVILSRSARSSRLTTHFDLDFPKRPQTEPYHCYKHSRTCQPVQEAFKFLHRYSLDTIRRVEEFAKLRQDSEIRIVCGDARQASPGQVDGMITSPPYVGLIDYHEQHRYAYELLDLPMNGADEIGASFKGSSQKAKEEYKAEIGAVFNRAAQFMPSGAPAVIVVRDKDNLYAEIAGRCGFRCDYLLERHVNRRTGRRAGKFFEQIHIWRKK